MSVMVMVCGLNFVKVTCRVYTLILFRKGAKDSDQTSLESPEGDHSLVTVGDAVASFLKRPDKHTKYLPLVTKHDFVKGRWPASGNDGIATRYRRLSHVQLWYKAPTRRRWLLLLARSVSSVNVFRQSLIQRSSAAAAAFVVYMVVDSFTILRRYQIPTDVTNLFATGLGSPQPYALTLSNQLANLKQGAQSLAAIFVANLAQLLVSALYFLVTGLIAVMAIADEWSRFLVERKTLRLSSPHSIQRSSYFLALPYRLSVPLMGGMAILHWLISQSIFVIATEAYFYAGTQATESLARIRENDAYMVGFSFPGAMLALIIGICLLLWTAYLGLSKKLEGTNMGHTGGKFHVPLASSCSAAISAACHRPEVDDAAHLLPVIWGRVPNSDLWCFTSAKKVEHTLRDDVTGRRERW